MQKNGGGVTNGSAANHLGLFNLIPNQSLDKDL